MGLTFSQPTPSSPKKQPPESPKKQPPDSSSSTSDNAINASGKKAAAETLSENSSSGNENPLNIDASTSVKVASTTNESGGAAMPPALKTDDKSLIALTKYKGIEDVQFLDEEKLPYLIELKPHVHSLFCERKQRVCTSMGKLQELEYVNIVKNPAAIASPQRRKSMTEQALFQQSLVLNAAPKGAWIRIFRDFDEEENNHKKKYDNLEVFRGTAICFKNNVDTPTDFKQNSAESAEDKDGSSSSSSTYEWNFHYAIIPGTENVLSYQLTVQDVGCYISYRLEKEPKAASPTNFSQLSARDYFESECNKAEASSSASTSNSIPTERPRSQVMANLFGSDNTDSNSSSSNINQSNAGKTFSQLGNSDSSASASASTNAPLPIVHKDDNKYVILRPMGYVLPGPPRLLSFDIELIDAEATAKLRGNTSAVLSESNESGDLNRSVNEASQTSLTLNANVDPDNDITNSAYFPVSKPVTSVIVGDRLVARGNYIGGYEGHSEYWWLRVSDKGERSEVKLITPISEGDKFSDADPRVLVITQNDLNCEFKVKCRPARDDHVKGEIFTSKPTPQVRVNRSSE